MQMAFTHNESSFINMGWWDRCVRALARLAASRAVAIETPRGWRIGKQQQTHKIDVVDARLGGQRRRLRGLPTRALFPPRDHRRRPDVAFLRRERWQS
jgi:hypothetical protein